MKIVKAMLIAICALTNPPCFAMNNTSITFPDACAKGESIVIAAVGDVLLHTPLQEKAEKAGFQSLWSEAIPFIKQANIAYANIEGPMAKGMKRQGDDAIYSSFPYFNYDPTLAVALKNSGFTIVSTANNHVLDRFSIGIDKTIASLNQAQLSYVGTRERNSNKPWFYILKQGSFKIAWIACTEVTNDNPDTYHQVLHCYGRNDRPAIIDMINTLKHQVDAIIILPHWGEEYHTKPNSDQIEFAHEVLNAGATAVIGSHPHVLQPLQKYVTKDGRSTLIEYSLGNFVSYQENPLERTTIILLLGLTKKSDGTTIINGVRFVPMYMQNRSGIYSIHLDQAHTEDQVLLNDILSHVMPMANAIYSQPVITNPECEQ